MTNLRIIPQQNGGQTAVRRVGLTVHQVAVEKRNDEEIEEREEALAVAQEILFYSDGGDGDAASTDDEDLWDEDPEGVEDGEEGVMEHGGTSCHLSTVSRPSSSELPPPIFYPLLPSALLFSLSLSRARTASPLMKQYAKSRAEQVTVYACGACRGTGTESVSKERREKSVDCCICQGNGILHTCGPRRVSW